MTRPAMEAAGPGLLQPRQYGAVNWLGLWTLCLRETRRFWKVGMQTLFAPVVSSLLMLFVFKLAFGQGSAATTFSTVSILSIGTVGLAYPDLVGGRHGKW